MASAALMGGCGELPEIEYETDRLEIATSFDAPVCAGTLHSLDEHVGRVETALGVGYRTDPIRVYWLSADEVQDYCGEGRGGCFYPATRVLMSRGLSLTHEIVHAVLDSKGESYFVEEGMAEMLSGVGVYYDPRTSTVSPADALSLSRTEYRSGGLDYAAAAHFVRWVYETAGPSAMIGLADEIEARSSAQDIEDQLELVMDRSTSTIVDEYRTSAPTYYPGLAHGTVAELSTVELRAGVTVALDCASEDTRGPLPEGSAGMYRVFVYRMPAAGAAQLSVSGPATAFVEIIDPHARLARGWIQDWTQPESRLDPKAVRVGAGQRLQVNVRPRDYLIVVGVQGTDAVDVTVSLDPPQLRWDNVPERSRD